MRGRPANSQDTAKSLSLTSGPVVHLGNSTERMSPKAATNTNV